MIQAIALDTCEPRRELAPRIKTSYTLVRFEHGVLHDVFRVGWIRHDGADDTNRYSGVSVDQLGECSVIASSALRHKCPLWNHSDHKSLPIVGGQSRVLIAAISGHSRSRRIKISNVPATHLGTTQSGSDPKQQ